jgi:hypothetical protein
MEHKYSVHCHWPGRSAAPPPIDRITQLLLPEYAGATLAVTNLSDEGWFTCCPAPTTVWKGIADAPRRLSEGGHAFAFHAPFPNEYSIIAYSDGEERVRFSSYGHDPFAKEDATNPLQNPRDAAMGWTSVLGAGYCDPFEFFRVIEEAAPDVYFFACILHLLYPQLPTFRTLATFSLAVDSGPLDPPETFQVVTLPEDARK